MNERRWDKDDRGEGVGDAAVHLPAARRLLDAMGRPRWVAEAPEMHLLPHLAAACEQSDGRWRITATESDADGRYTVELDWRSTEHSLQALRREAFALIGAIAEASTHVRSAGHADGVEFQVTTGQLDGDGEFRSHGHTLLLRVRGETVAALLQRRGQ